MRRLIFINKVGKNENSYVVGSNIGGQSRFVRNALKKHASNNSQGLCCDGISNTASNTFSWNYNETLTYEINVTANGSSSYNLAASNPLGATSGGPNSTISMNVGDTVNFNVNAANHPFYIKTIQGTGTAYQVSNPVATNQGSQSGQVTWTPNAAATYYYVCSSHGAMNGEIIVS